MAADRERALVTGASAGIGEAFAERLARDGFDLVVVARRGDRLEALAERLRTKHGAEVEVIDADLSTDDGIARVERAAAEDDRLTMLVNNAGFGGYKPFADLEPGAIDALVGVHVLAPLRVTRAALPGMVARGRGSVITIASLLAFSGPIANPFLPARATYAGAKAFQVAWTQVVANELEGTGVRVTVCCPGVVKTEFHEVQGMDMSSLPRMSPEDVVQGALAASERGEIVNSPPVDDVNLWDRLAAAQTAAFANGRTSELAPRYRT